MANSAFVPDSMHSFLAGALRTNFGSLTKHLDRDPAFGAAKLQSQVFLKSLLEELFRYLFLLASNSSDGIVRCAPSYFVRKAHSCIMLDPVLYFRVCDEILTLQGQDRAKVRVLPSNPHEGFGEDKTLRISRFADTVAKYKQTFKQEPPQPIWCDYCETILSDDGIVHAVAAPVATSPPEPSPAATKKISLTTLWEITVKYVVGQKELTEYEGAQVIQCWHDTESISDSVERMEKLKRLLAMKFGANVCSVYELLMKRREQTLQMIQQKQQQKRQQAEVGGSNCAPGRGSVNQAQHGYVQQGNPACAHTRPTQVPAPSSPQPSHSSSQAHLGSAPQQQQARSPLTSAHPFNPPMRTGPSTSAESSDRTEQPARKRQKAATKSTEKIAEEDVGGIKRACEGEIGGVIDITDPYSEGREIIVKCKYHFGEEIFVIMNPLTPMAVLMSAVAKRVDRPLHALHFLVDGIRMTPSFTWESWGMENGAEVDVMLSSDYR